MIETTEPTEADAVEAIGKALRACGDRIWYRRLRWSYHVTSELVPMVRKDGRWVPTRPVRVSYRGVPVPQWRLDWYRKEREREESAWADWPSEPLPDDVTVITLTEDTISLLGGWEEVERLFGVRA